MAKLGLHTFAIAPEWDAGAMAAQARRLKALGVALLEAPLLRPATFDAAATRAFAEREGFEIVPSLGLPGDVDPVADPDAALAFLEPALDMAAAMGAACLSGVTYGSIGKTTGQPRTQEEEDGTARFLARAAAAARKRALRLGVEPCNRYETHLLNTAAQAKAMIEKVGADNLFCHLDTYHMNIEEDGFEAGFQAIGGHLGYVHLSESHRGVPGRGAIDWDAAMRGLVAIGYDGPLTLESMNHVDRDIASGLAIWRPVAEPADAVIDEGLPFLAAKIEAAGLALERLD